MDKTNLDESKKFANWFLILLTLALYYKKNIIMSHIFLNLKKFKSKVFKKELFFGKRFYVFLLD